MPLTLFETVLTGLLATTLVILAITTVRHRRTIARLGAAAVTDELTGLTNRRSFDAELRREMERAARGGQPLSIALLDLDRFKAFNDRHGHGAGDDLLRQFSANAAPRLRAIDQLARVGGEEFAVLLPSCLLEEARVAIDRLRVAVPHGQTFSGGVAHWDGDESVETLVRRADQALYEAKSAGRGCTMRALEATLSTEVARTPQAAAAARGALAELRDRVEPDALDSLGLLVSELVAAHVRDRDDGTLRMRVWVSPSTVRAEVVSAGGPARRRPSRRGDEADPSRELVERLSDRAAVSPAGAVPEWVEIRRRSARRSRFGARARIRASEARDPAREMVEPVGARVK